MFSFHHKNKQEELFSDLSSGSKKPKKTSFHLTKSTISFAYENIIIFCIALIMLLIACYSLGVEKGKHLAQLKLKAAKQEKQEQVLKIPASVSLKPKEQKKANKMAVAKDISKTAPYIQVATFRTDKYAGKEKDRLEKSGYQTFVIARGKFKEVCVGGYKDRQQAHQAFKQLRKLYADCILHYK